MFKILRIGLGFLFFLAFVFWANFTFGREKIDINTAPLEDLVKIIHIGKARALELISLRPFSSLDDLVRIRGISKKRIEDIKKQGLAWVGVQKESNLKLEPRPKPKSAIYPSNIFINEILPSPEGPDFENEWIEIFNSNNFEVDISDWQIKDEVGKTSAYTFPKGTKISGKGFLLLKRKESKITLNNNGDGLLLIRPDGKIADEIRYEKALFNYSYSKIGSKWVWTKSLTPKAPNLLLDKAQKPKKQIQELSSQKGSATMSESIKKNQILNPVFPSLIAFGTAIFSGITILFLKRKINSKQ